MAEIDKYPQWLNGLDVTDSAAGAYTEDSIETPIILEEAILMELHKILWSYNVSDTRTQVHLQNQGGQTTSFKPIDPEVIAHLHLPASSQGSSYTDLTDGSGRGLLVAAKNLYLAIDADGTPSGNSSASAKILYRLVKVAKGELIDILTD